MNRLIPNLNVYCFKRIKMFIVRKINKMFIVRKRIKMFVVRKELKCL